MSYVIHTDSESQHRFAIPHSVTAGNILQNDKVRDTTVLAGTQIPDNGAFPGDN